MTEPLSPNMLRFVQCGLPDEVAARFALFLDDFELRTMEIEEQFKSFELNEKPLLIAALDAQVDMRKKLIEGGLVPELSSLDAIEDSLKLTSPAKGDDDPDVVSQDERKLGAAGIVCLFGRLFAKTNTTELLAFRELWKSVDGDFDAFLALGDGVAASLDIGQSVSKASRALRRQSISGLSRRTGLPVKADGNADPIPFFEIKKVKNNPPSKIT